LGVPDLIVSIKDLPRQLAVDLAVLNRMRLAGLQKEIVEAV
jgi:hypothetical protein